MSRVHLKPQIPFLDAVRLGRLAVVRQYLDDPRFGDSQFQWDEKTQESIVPFDHALDHRRWAVAAELFNRRHEAEGLLPEPFEDDQATGPGIRDTVAKRAFNLFLQELFWKRDLEPLPRAVVAQMEPMLEAVVDQEDLDAALLRTLVFQPSWLGWAQELLARGANPNAFVVGNNTAATLTPLAVAAARGLEAQVEALLQAGADPLYKFENFDLAAHRAANPDYFAVPKRKGAVCLDTVARRWRCVDRLMEYDGVAQARGADGRTPGQVMEHAHQWLRDQRGPDPDEPESVRRAWNQQRLELVLPQNPNPAPRMRM